MTLTERVRHFDWRSGIISALIAAPFAVLLASIFNAAIDRVPPIIYERVRALSDSVPQGGLIRVEFSVLRLRLCDGEVARWLIDSAGVKHSIPSFTIGPRPLAGLDTYRRTITIPEAAALGQATYQVDLEYSCNLIHRLGWPIEIHSPPIRFEITPRPLILLPPLVPPPDTDS